jgi:hypothetical protein
MFVRKSLLLLLIIVVLSTGPAIAAVPAEELNWEQVGPGVEYYKFQLPDPNNVYVVRMDRSNPSVTLESSIAQGKLAGGREAVSGMFSRYDQALNFWGGSNPQPTWGLRNQVIAAINGSYFDYSGSMPQGGQVNSGWYAKRYDDLGGWSGFAWKLDRSAFIGKCVAHNPEKQVIAYPATGATQQIAQVNPSSHSDELVLFTPQYNTRTGTSAPGAEVVVELTRPTLINPTPAYVSGVVRQIHTNSGNTLIPFNSIVLSASGSAAQKLLANAVIGQEVRISQEITSYDTDCETKISLSWTKTYASIQGAFFFLDNGTIRDFDDPGATSPDPRTAIAFNDQYVFFIVVDGRDVRHGLGMTIHELALFARDTLGATYAVAEDGGGSSTMVINGKVVNNTLCNIYLCMGSNVTYLPMVFGNSQNEHDGSFNERLVANGMLMVAVQPEEHSTAFSTGDAVIANSSLAIRLGPGTNFASFSSISAGAQGTILDQMNSLNGILAKSSYWWYVDFAGVSGWVPQEALSAR